MTRERRMASTAIGAILTIGLVATACSSNSSSSSSPASGSGFTGTALTGAGATFPDPIYEQWFQDFKQLEPDAKINYQAIGSGGGIEQFTAQTVDFGASDAPLQTDEIAALPADYIELPTVLGGVVIAYNVSGVDSGLKLDGETAAKIFQGQITSWDDQAIASLNPGVQLPNTPISVVHRSDESGTTFVFTSWLSAESPAWKSAVGADKAVSWPTGTGGDGNDGVAASLTQTDGSIGYLSYDFAVTSNLGIADIQRDDGTFVTPSIESISKAGGDLTFPITPTTNILNSRSDGAYPIASTTYLLLYKDMSDQTKAQTLFDFVNWALTTGQGSVKQLNYSPLPDQVAQQAQQALGQMTSNGQTLSATTG
jgi:phosphate transport system substrate-binding protein